MAYVPLFILYGLWIPLTYMGRLISEEDFESRTVCVKPDDDIKPVDDDDNSTQSH